MPANVAVLEARTILLTCKHIEVKTNISPLSIDDFLQSSWLTILSIATKFLLVNKSLIL